MSRHISSRDNVANFSSMNILQQTTEQLRGAFPTESLMETLIGQQAASLPVGKHLKILNK